MQYLMSEYGGAVAVFFLGGSMTMLFGILLLHVCL